VMGLAAFGSPHDLKMPPLEVVAGKVFIPEDWISLFRNTAKFSSVDPKGSSFNDSARVAAAGQLAFELALSKVIAWLHAETGLDALCFAGGAALNCVANNRIRTTRLFKQLFIPPAPGDAGTALGCALYGLSRMNSHRSTFRWQHDFLGPPQDVLSVLDVVKGFEGLLCRTMANPVVELADLICVGRVIGLIRGRSEFGPRALGHRSIIADATKPGIREWINANIKGREWFRPLAPMVLADDAELYFDLDVDSPHMAYACDVRAAARQFLPAVTHVDGTARVQTVNQNVDRFAYELLKAVKSRTGHGVLLNTSFNGQDEPIVETLNEALAGLCKSALHAVAYPPYLITKVSAPGT
jgi:carbamoyltransferase